MRRDRRDVIERAPEIKNKIWIEMEESRKAKRERREKEMNEKREGGNQPIIKIWDETEPLKYLGVDLNRTRDRIDLDRNAGIAPMKTIRYDINEIMSKKRE